MQVNVFDSANKPIGRGYVASDGSFELINREGSGPLHLLDGNYRFTIESVGAEVEIPDKFTDPATTPLVIDHRSGILLNLELPKLIGV